MTNTINGWIATDKSKAVVFYKSEPRRIGDTVFIPTGAEHYRALLPSEFAPELTFENSPKKCTITVELEEL